MSDPPASSLEARLEAISQDLRKFGRAALAAQAAAESCTEALETRPREAEGGDDAAALVRALLPVVDALDRVAAEADHAARETTTPSFLARLGGARDASARTSALARGIALVKEQLEDALASAGAVLDRRVDVPVDGDVHRVVETRDGARGGVVVAVVRTGCSLRGKLIREADVVATREKT